MEFADLDIPKVSVEQGLQILASNMGKLAEDPGRSFLALVQAGSYMRETVTSTSEYLQFYNYAWRQLMSETEADPMPLAACIRRGLSLINLLKK